MIEFVVGYAIGFFVTIAWLWCVTIAWLWLRQPRMPKTVVPSQDDIDRWKNSELYKRHNS